MTETMSLRYVIKIHNDTTLIEYTPARFEHVEPMTATEALAKLLTLKAQEPLGDGRSYVISRAD